MKYSKEIKELALLISKKKSLTSYSQQRRPKQYLEYQKIKKYTSFLPEETKIRERIWYILNDVYNIVLCLECQICPVKFRNGTKINKFCSQKCAAKNNIIKEKIKQTNIERYGGILNGSTILKERIQQTNLIKYGVKKPLQNKDIREKIKYTNIEQYGVENPFQNEDIKRKSKQTKKERYGDANYNNIEQQKETIKKRYNVENISQIPSVKEKVKIKNTKTTQYIINLAREVHGLLYDYSNCVYSHSSIPIEIICEIHGSFFQLASNHISAKQGCPKCAKGGQSAMAIEWLEYEMEKDGIFIQHAENLGEFKIPGTRYGADGYCKETNTIYEFHGDYWHGNLQKYLAEDINPSNYITYGELYEATMKRMQHIKALGYNVVYIWESDWKNNKSSNHL